MVLDKARITGIFQATHLEGQDNAIAFNLLQGQEIDMDTVPLAQAAKALRIVSTFLSETPLPNDDKLPIVAAMTASTVAASNRLGTIPKQEQYSIASDLLSPVESIQDVHLRAGATRNIFPHCSDADRRALFEGMLEDLTLYAEDGKLTINTQGMDALAYAYQRAVPNPDNAINPAAEPKDLS